MKNYKEYILILVLALIISSLDAQTINWANLKKENKNIITASFGMEYGVVYGLGYGHQIKAGIFPVVLNLEYSFPSGNKIYDDFKTKIGGQVRWFDYDGFQFSTKIDGVFR